MQRSVPRAALATPVPPPPQWAGPWVVGHTVLGQPPLLASPSRLGAYCMRWPVLEYGPLAWD
jgi:hypothetical protein